METHSPQAREFSGLKISGWPIVSVTFTITPIQRCYPSIHFVLLFIAMSKPTENWLSPIPQFPFRSSLENPFIYLAYRLLLFVRFTPMQSIPSPITPGTLSSHHTVLSGEPLSPIVHSPCHSGYSSASPSAPSISVSSSNDNVLTTTPTG